MIVSELVAKLGFTVDGSGAKQFDSSMVTMRDRLIDFQHHINQVGNTSGAVMKGIAAGIGFAATNIALSLATAVGRGLVNLTTSFVTAGDEYGAAMMRLGQATSGPQQATEVYDQLYRSARQTGVAVMDSAKVFMQFNPAVEKAGLGVRDTTNLIDGLNKAMVMSGSTTARTGAVLTQIGQALNSGNFAGDELKSFLENAPTKIIDAFATAIGKTREELKKLGSTGKLTNAVVLPGLLAAAKAAQAAFPDEMASVSLAWKGLGAAVTDFGGKLNKLLGVNRNLSRAINAVADAFEWMAKGVTAIQKLVDSIGGLRRIVEGLAIAIGMYFTPAFLAALGPAALFVLSNFRGGLAFLITGFLTLARAIIVAALPAAALLSTFLLIEDFIGWLRGYDSLFGRKFGEFDEVSKKIKDGITQIEAYINQMVNNVSAKFVEMWKNLYAGMPAWAKTLLGGIGIGDPNSESGESGGGVMDGIRGMLRRSPWQADPDSAIGRFMNGSGGPTLPGSGGIGELANSIVQMMNKPLFPVGSLPFSGPAQVTQSNNNTINVTATGTDGASIATAAQSGVTQANQSSINTLGNIVARGLLTASPRSEAAAQ